MTPLVSNRECFVSERFPLVSKVYSGECTFVSESVSKLSASFPFPHIGEEMGNAGSHPLILMNTPPPISASKPTKQMRLVCWFLLHRVHPETLPTEEHEREACKRFRLQWEKWTAAKLQFPGLIEKVHAKRARVLAYGRIHGKVTLGWTPPDPADRRTANVHYGHFGWKLGKRLRAKWGV